MSLQGEGVAYRGRVLVQLDTLLGDLPESPIDDILSEDVYKVQKFQRRRKFRLHCAFMNATMVSAIDAPVEFEVSIGTWDASCRRNCESQNDKMPFISV